MNYLKLTKEKLDVGAINDCVADRSCGAISMFVGTTRDYFEEKKVLCLEYEAYEPMALKTMDKICEDMRSQWPDIKHVAIYHRLGTVPVKEASVAIAVSSPHRQTSLLSVQFAIDELKKSVPIWKKERYEDDGATWKENKECSFGGKLKRPKLDFEQCNVETSCIPKNLVQIGADPGEVARRIQSFIEKKREEIDVNNVTDFTCVKPESKNGCGETCARVNSVVMKQKDSKGHLKVQRVKNLSGPQMKVDYAGTLDKLMGHRSRNSQQEAVSGIRIKQEPEESSIHVLPGGVAERIENAEKFLNITRNTSKDVYERIKAIENRILFLETISPEYHHFLNPKSVESKKMLKKTYSVKDLDGYIQQLKQNMSESESTT